VILDFGRNEFEGIGSKYHFDDVKTELKDKDGELIRIRDFQEVNKENTPRKQNNKRKSSEVVYDDEKKKARVEKSSEDKMDISDDDFEDDKMDVVKTSSNKNGKRRSSRSRKRVNYNELADEDEDLIPIKKSKTKNGDDDDEAIDFVAEMIALAKTRRQKEKRDAVKRRTARAKTRKNKTLENVTSSYFDPRLSGGDISTAPEKILRKQFMRVWDLLSDAHLKSNDFDFGGHGLKFQTACSGTYSIFFFYVSWVSHTLEHHHPSTHTHTNTTLEHRYGRTDHRDANVQRDGRGSVGGTFGTVQELEIRFRAQHVM